MPALVFLSLSRGFCHCTINIMPDFQPNEFLFENHKHSNDHMANEEIKENERWETFAWAVRDAMIKAGDFDRRVFTWSENHAYEIYMNKDKGAPAPPILERILKSNRDSKATAVSIDT